MLVHKPTPTPDERINEDSPIGASWAYPQSKVDAETLLHERHGNISVVYMRAAGVYDDDGRSAFLAQQISQIYEHRLISHFYSGMLCARSEEQPSELQSLMRITYSVFCL